MSEAPEELRCPVCRASFRGSSDCSRCGADLRRLMHLALWAYTARQATRKALRAGDLRRARAHLRTAQACQATDAGTHLDWLCRDETR